ncbi:MAG: thioredoxin domain-containing protein [Gordonia sp. (in: high G+C Gram-positive bacteria)]|uniref:DsbA family protein n=1 Tax=Gordonia sp. (in: high G+C Gram-positive bacteria) TaxID=84139 RepID=UPI003C7560DB
MAQNKRTVIDPRQADRRRSLMWKILSVVVLIILAAIVAFWAISSNSEDSATGGTDVPTVLTDNGSIRITGAPANTEPKAVVTVVEDFQCPACGAFEQSSGQTLTELGKRADVAVDYRPIAFLDRGQTSYSTNAMNASLCVAESIGKDGGKSKWLAFHNSLFVNQRPEGSAGFDDGELNKMANDAGVEGVKTCISDKQFGKWVATQTQTVMETPGFTGTPFVTLNGKPLEAKDPASLTAAVDAAVAAK